MHKKKITLIILILIICSATIALVAIRTIAHRDSSVSMLERIENALGDDFKKQTKTELAATLTYSNEDGSNKVYYHILKTTYYEADPSEITGLHTEAFNVLFPVNYMDSCEEMKIQEWDGALYKKGQSAYLCWTYSPEISYVLEYNPDLMEDSEILKMAQSAELYDE